MPRSAPPILLIALLFTAACNFETYSGDAETYTEDADAYVEPYEPTTDARESMRSSFNYDQSSEASASGNRVAIFDQGFRMTRGTQVIPGDWKLSQDIATDPQTAKMARYHLEIRGPDGELIKGLGMTPYGEAVGTSFGQALHQMTMHALGGEIQDISLGNLQRSVTLEQTPGFQKAIRIGQERGLQTQALEVPFTGHRQGNALRGIVYVWHFTSPNMPGMGTIQGSAVAAGPKNFENAVRTNEQIAHSYRTNPQFEQRIRQATAAAMQRSNAEHRQWMAGSQAQHRQRMADNQARFDSHQRIIQDRAGASDQQHAQWMEGFRNSGSSAWSESDYTGHDSYIDGIHERSTFQDPYSGQQVSQDGQYDNWYNNGLGEYYGTDDPSFDPNSLDGNWQRIEPLQPNR